MSFDPNKPQNGEQIEATPVRNNFNALKALLDAIPAGPPGPQGIQGPQGNQGDRGDGGPQGPPGEVSTGQLDMAIATTSSNTNAVATLDTPMADPDMETLRQKINELLSALRR